METLRIDTSEGESCILIAPGARDEAGTLSGRKFLVCDSNVAKLHGKWAEETLKPEGVFVFPAGESSKTIDTVIGICRRAAELRLDRRSSCGALGGGVTGDIAGFAAAIYLRGVDVIQIPTTLLAMVDSSVGGKTAVDIPEGKNLVGAFHQPRRVFSDPRFLATLPPRELRNGLAEAVKTAVLGDGELFLKLERLGGALLETPLPEDAYEEIVLRCCRVKAAVVAEDEKEHGRRAILNYGHTFGHALELLSDFSLPHGEGVAIGMTVAAKLAVKLNFLDPETAERQLALLRALGLPTEPSFAVDPDAWLKAMSGDKKARDGRPVLVLPEAIGKVGAEDGVPPEALAAFLREITA